METYARDTYKLEDAFDESNDYSAPGLDAPRRSPMRRKEKFRIREFEMEKKHRDRQRDFRNNIRYDFKFLEE